MGDTDRTTGGYYVVWEVLWWGEDKALWDDGGGLMKEEMAKLGPDGWGGGRCREERWSAPRGDDGMGQKIKGLVLPDLVVCWLQKKVHLGDLVSLSSCGYWVWGVGGQGFCQSSPWTCQPIRGENHPQVPPRQVHRPTGKEELSSFLLPSAASLWLERGLPCWSSG